MVARIDAHHHQGLGDFVFHGVEQLAKQLKSFALVFLLGLLLCIAAQVNALAQVIQRAQVFAPMGVDALQQDHALKGHETLCPHLVELGLKLLMGCCDDHLQQVFVRNGTRRLHLALQVQAHAPLFGQNFFQTRQVPLLFHRFDRHKLAQQIGEAAFTQRRDLGVHVLRIQNVVALLVNHLALVIGHVVVFQQLLADVEVPGFHLTLGAFDAARDDARFDGLALGHLQTVHDGAHAVARKNAHQRIVQAQIKA